MSTLPTAAAALPAPAGLGLPAKFSAWRPGQYAAIDQACQALSTSENQVVVVINALTGAGKSGIAPTLANVPGTVQVVLGAGALVEGVRPECGAFREGVELALAGAVARLLVAGSPCSLVPGHVPAPEDLDLDQRAPITGAVGRVILEMMR